MNDGSNRSTCEPQIVMMDPKEILPSLFADDVNPIATEEEDLSLRESIAKDGVQVPLTVGRIGGKGKNHIVKGTRRWKFAIELGLAEVPVQIREYGSLEEMRQDALRDNLERRQLSRITKARLANGLWASYETAPDKREMSAQGMSPRKRAAVAGGLSEGSLAAFRYVMDSGIPKIIEDIPQATCNCENSII